MKSTMFRADEGLGELSLPGAPQVGGRVGWGVLLVLSFTRLIFTFHDRVWVVGGCSCSRVVCFNNIINSFHLLD